MSSASLSLDSQTLGTATRELRANVFAHRWGVVVQVFVPGCETRDLQVKIDGETLMVCATIPARDLGIPLGAERCIGESDREFALTPDLDISRLTRSLADGILTMVIPRHGALVETQARP